MYYYEHTVGNTRIEFFNSFSGKETVRVNGQVVSSKSSILGTDHRFEVVENGNIVRYCLLTKMGGITMVMIDLVRNHEYVLRNHPIPYGNGSAVQESAYLKAGIKALRAYDLPEAEQQLTTGLRSDPKNPQLYFYLACVYSLQEKKKPAFDNLVKALDNGLVDRQQIATEDGLAYIRIEEEFEAFCITYGIDYP